MVAPGFRGRSDDDPLLRFRSAVERLLDRFERERGVDGLLPPLTVAEERERFVVHVEVPGLRMEDLEITGQVRAVAFRSERAAPRERRVGVFGRSVELPAEIDPAGIQAVFRDGVLEISIPKAPRPRPKLLDVLKPRSVRDIQ